MTYTIPLPTGGRRRELDLVEPNSTAVQRFLRRDGLSAYEPPTIATLLALFDAADPGFTFFDIGANMGLYALVAAAVFDPGAVEAFEPTPTTAAVLRAVVSANRLDVDVFEVALGDLNGRATLHLSEKTDASNSLVEGFKTSHHGVDVETVCLDDHVARTGRPPDIMKIDVETFEAAVLAGASATISSPRPSIVIEVLNRRGHDHGEEITRAMAAHGYSYYELSAEPSWQAQTVIRGRAGSVNNDWLLTPRPLDAEFGLRWQTWRSRLDECGPERNSRVPLLLSAKTAFHRGGVSEVYSAGRRYWTAGRRKRGRPPN